MRGQHNKAFLSFLLPSWLVLQLLSFLGIRTACVFSISSYLMQSDEKGLGCQETERIDQYEWVQRFASRGKGLW